MSSSRPLVVIGIVAAALAAFVMLRPKPVAVEVVPVVVGPLMVTVDEEGETRVRKRYVVAAPVSGRLERIEVDEGDKVEEGTVVARMRPQPLDPRLAAEAAARLEAAQAARSEAQAKVEQARAALAQAQRTAERSRRLAVDGTISKEELELTTLQEVSRQKELAAGEHAAERAEFDVRAAEAALLASGARSNDRPDDEVVTIGAPASGSVLRVFEESERVVAVGSPLLSIGDPRELEIVVDVLSKDAVLIHPGSRVIIDEWGGPQPLEARVRLVEPAGFTKTSALGVEEQRVNVIADFETLPANLGDAFRVETRIVVWQADKVIKVPTHALFRDHGQWTVFAVDSDTARHRKVDVGHIGSAEAEIVQGLQEGEQVVAHPSDALTDGSRISF